MVGHSCCHGRRTRLPSTLSVIDLHLQGLDRPREDPRPNLPRHTQLRASQAVWNTTTSCALIAHSSAGWSDWFARHTTYVPHHCRHLAWGSVHHLDCHPGEAIARAMFDHLQIVPVRLGLLACRRASLAAILGHLPPGLEHGLAIAALTISRHGWWSVGMSTSLQLRH